MRETLERMIKSNEIRVESTISIFGLQSRSPITLSSIFPNITGDQEMIMGWSSEDHKNLDQNLKKDMLEGLTGIDDQITLLETQFKNI